MVQTKPSAGNTATFVTIHENEQWRLFRVLCDAETWTTSAQKILSNNEEWLASKSLDAFTEKTAKAEARDYWMILKKWFGNSNRQTETFEISNHEWQIEWTTKNEQVAGMLIVYLYKEDGNLVSTPVNQTGVANSSTYVRGTGRYYLDIQSANIDWEIRVLDQ